MSGSSVFPLSSNNSNVTLLPRKFQAKSDDDLPFCAFFILCQVFWYSIALSLIYDIAERMWHWPHVVVAGLYGGMLVASAWLNRATVKLGSVFTVLLLLVTVYYANVGVTSQLGFMKGLVQIMQSRCIDYTSWLFVMGSSFIGCLSLVWVVNNKHINLALWLALASFLLGCTIAILPEATLMRAKGADMESIFASQGLNLLWLAYWGIPMKSAYRGNAGPVSKSIAKCIHLPLRTIVLFMGAISYIFYDWACQYLATWLQIIWFFSPIVLYFYMQKRQITKL